MQQPTRTFGFDWLILVPVLYLLLIGFAIQRSLLAAGNEDVNLVVQLVATLAGLGLLFVLRSTSSSAMMRLAVPLYLGSAVLLVMVLLVGEAIQGSQRWIDVGGFQLQPSEIAKVSLILITARLLALRREAINSPVSFVVVALYVLVPSFLVLIQPDLGTAITFVAIWFAMLAVSRLRRSTLLLLVVMAALFVGGSYPLLASYQQERVTSFLNPAADPLGSGYNIIQSTIAIGSGGLTGKGLDAGSQSQFNFLPSAHTDFVFAVTAEKLGLLGAASILVAFLVIILRAIMIAWSSTQEYGRYVATGVATLLIIQVVVNIGMNLGVMPITGLPLPFMSYGGSHILIELSMIGLLLGVSRQ